jgi:hypothetical protein
MLVEFEKFVGWTETNWPQIDKTITLTVHAIADSILFMTEMLDASTVKGQAFRGSLEALEAPFKPIILAVEVVGAELSALGAIIDYVSSKFDKLKQIASGISGFASALSPALPGAGLLGEGLSWLAPQGGAVSGVDASGGISSLLSNGITESGHAVDARREVNMSGMQIHVVAPDGSSPESLAQRIHSELARLLHQTT